MSNDQIVVRSGGIGFLGMLTIVLLILKLVGTISISWFMVFLPVLIGPLIFVGVFGFIAVAAAVLFTIEAMTQWIGKR